MSSKGHDVSIRQDSRGIVKVFIDGMELKNITKVNYYNATGSIPELSIDFIPTTLNLESLDKNIAEKLIGAKGVILE